MAGAVLYLCSCFVFVCTWQECVTYLCKFVSVWSICMYLAVDSSRIVRLLSLCVYLPEADLAIPCHYTCNDLVKDVIHKIPCQGTGGVAQPPCE